MEGPGKRVCRFIFSGTGSGGRRQEQQRAKKKGRKKVSGGETGKKRNGATLIGPVPRTPLGIPRPARHPLEWSRAPCILAVASLTRHLLASPRSFHPPTFLTKSINLAFACTQLAFLRPRSHACLHIVMRASHLLALMSAVDRQISTPSSPLQHLLQHKFQTRVQSVASRSSCTGARLGSVHLHKTRARRTLQRLRVRVYLS